MLNVLMVELHKVSATCEIRIMIVVESSIQRENDNIGINNLISRTSRAGNLSRTATDFI